jgi:hypothetical protein
MLKDTIMNGQTTRIAVLLLLNLVLLVELHGQEKERRVNLAGDWHFALGDNMKFARPEFDDSDWEEIYVPSEWQREGFRNYHGYAWYRKKVTIDVESKDALYLELGKIDDVDEVYFNGHFIGRTGGFPPDYFTAYNYNRRYHIPSEIINKGGKNVIAVRVYDEGGEGGIMGSGVGIYNYINFSDNSVHLFGKWKFRMSDNPKWGAENMDDSDWEDIIVPASWESQGFEHYDGFAWYRKTFPLPANFKTEDLLILMGKIDDMDQVYINGKLVGQTGNMDRRWAHNDEYSRFRTYAVPPDLLHAGKDNVIAVRVYDQEGVGGIYEGPVTLLPQKEYKQFWRSYRMNSGGDNFFNWLSYYFED